MATPTSKRLFRVALLLGLTLPVPALAEDAISIANMSFRAGPFADAGTPLMNG